MGRFWWFCWVSLTNSWGSDPKQIKHRTVQKVRISGATKRFCQRFWTGLGSMSRTAESALSSGSEPSCCYSPQNRPTQKPLRPKLLKRSPCFWRNRPGSAPGPVRSGSLLQILPVLPIPPLIPPMVLSAVLPVQSDRSGLLLLRLHRPVSSGPVLIRF